MNSTPTTTARVQLYLNVTLNILIVLITLLPRTIRSFTPLYHHHHQHHASNVINSHIKRTRTKTFLILPNIQTNYNNNNNNTPNKKWTTTLVEESQNSKTSTILHATRNKNERSATTTNSKKEEDRNKMLQFYYNRFQSLGNAIHKLRIEIVQDTKENTDEVKDSLANKNDSLFYKNIRYIVHQDLIQLLTSLPMNIIPSHKNHHHQNLNMKDGNDSSTTIQLSKKVRSSLSYVCIQGIRILADIGDYRTIVTIVQKCSTIISKTSKSTPISFIDKRIYSEAIQGISRIPYAGTSKLRIIWKLFLQQQLHNKHTSNDDEAATSTRVLNEMIVGLGIKKKKPISALKLYNNYSHLLDGDEYSISILFQVFADSIITTNTNTTYSKHLDSSSSSNTVSECWQWKETCNVLDALLQNTSTNTNTTLWNNYIYGNALKVNEKAASSSIYYENNHNSSVGAKYILQHMKKTNVSPNNRICTLILSCFGKGNDWYNALQFLNDMKKEQQLNEDRIWKLPSPNIYSYATTISACITNQKPNLALTLFQELRRPTNPQRSNPIPLNTWIYNVVLRVYRIPPLSIQKVKQSFLLFEEMKKQKATTPDTITYNTLFHIMSTYYEEGERNNYDTYNYNRTDVTFLLPNSKEMRTDDDMATTTNISTVVPYLLSEMKQNGITRGSITYRYAIRASQSSLSNTLHIFHDHIISDITLDSTSSTENKNKMIQSIINSAIRVCAQHKNITAASALMDYMLGVWNIQPNSETAYWFLSCLTNDYQSMIESFEIITNSSSILMNDDDAATTTSSRDNNSHLKSILFTLAPHLTEQHYSLILSTLLHHHQFDTALNLVSIMKQQKYILPSSSSYLSIIHSCCSYAIEEDQKLKKMTQKKKKSLMNNTIQQFEPSSLSMSWANVALTLYQELNYNDDSGSSNSYNSHNKYNNLNMKVTIDVIKACAINNNELSWNNATHLLHILHERILQMVLSNTTNKKHIMSSSIRTTLQDLSKLHTFLFTICARRSNVAYSTTPVALTILDMILHLVDAISSPSIENGTNNDASFPSPLSSSGSTSSTTTDDNRTSVITDIIAMKSYDWRLLLVTASKNKNSQICYNTWQYLKPYSMQFQPARTNKNNTTSTTSLPPISIHSKEYKHLCKAFAHTLFCFELSISSTTYSVRALQDWLTWTNRRPPLYAVKSISRLLSRCGHGSQVIKLVDNILNVKDPDCTPKEDYETNLYTLAITDLHKNGLYHYADTLYLNAVKGNHLPWASVMIEENDDVSFFTTKKKKEDGNPVILDLHGMTTAVAHCAVQVALQQEICLTPTTTAAKTTKSILNHINQTEEEPQLPIWNRDVIIITGKGLHSKAYLKPILRPEIQRMLMEEFYPPIHSQSLPNNMGALLLKADDVNAWVEFQWEQKGLQFLVMANTLRRILYLPRWKRSILSLVNDLNSTTTTDSK